MSQGDTPPSRIEDPSDERLDPQAAPGCGLGLYALLLAGLGVAGLVGLIVATLALLQGDGTSPSELVSGKAVPTWRLAPMVEAGVLPVDQIPLAWHDESAVADGKRACALLADAVIRVQDGVGTRVPYAEVQKAELQKLPDGAEVVLVDGSAAELTCLFREGEGATRFLRQIQAEQLKIERASGG